MSPNNDKRKECTCLDGGVVESNMVVAYCRRCGLKIAPPSKVNQLTDMSRAEALKLQAEGKVTIIPPSHTESVSHETKQGWCCACDYDITQLEYLLSRQRQSLAEKVGKLRRIAPEMGYQGMVMGYDRLKTQNEMDKFNSALDAVLALLQEDE